MNTQYRKALPGTELKYYDTRQAVEDIQPGAYAKLPYTSKILAEQLVRRCDAESLTDSLKQLIDVAATWISPGTRRGWFATTSWARPPWWT